MKKTIRAPKKITVQIKRTIYGQDEDEFWRDAFERSVGTEGLLEEPLEINKDAFEKQMEIFTKRLKELGFHPHQLS